MFQSGTHRLSGRRGRVLVVDDEPFVARALGLFLGDEHDVTVVTDAKDALARFDAGEDYDVVLCDMMMPGMDGEAFLAALAEKHSARIERVVFITGGAYTPRARSFLARSKNECIEKPPDPFALRTMVRARVAALDEKAHGAEGTA